MAILYNGAFMDVGWHLSMFNFKVKLFTCSNTQSMLLERKLNKNAIYIAKSVSQKLPDPYNPVYIQVCCSLK